MKAVDVVALAAVVLVPLAVMGPVIARDRSGARRPFRPGILALALGAAAFAASQAVMLAVRRFANVEPPSDGAAGFVSVAYAFLVLGPLDESLRAAATLPALKSKELRTPYDAMRIATGAALGFSTCESAMRVVTAGSASGALVFRVLFALVAHVSLTSVWGFAIGRERRRKLGGTGFTRAFLAAVFFSALVRYLAFGRGPNALWAALPLVLSAALVALVARRDLLRMTDSSRKRRLSRLLPVSPPTLEELEHALLRRPDRPLMLRWIVLGAFVTTGVLTAMIVGSVFVGHGAGVDFAAVDQSASFDRSAPPLILLGSAALGAFPISGFLIARASAAHGVLEPALAAAIAIIGLVVLMGLAAPVAVVFGLALGPVAFALACAGAWAGLER